MSCAECGAPEHDRTCRERFDERLALEFGDARAGVVHLQTVACYQLQHPQAFRLGDEARAELRRMLEDVEIRDVPVAEARRRMGEAFAGATRVRERGDAAPPATPPRTWSMTIADLGPLDPARHAEQVHRWARAVLDDLGDG